MGSAYFEAGEAAVVDVSVPRLEANVALLLRCPALDVRLRGYVSACGADRQSGRGALRLSLDRADSVRAFYLRRGIREHQIVTVEGLGRDPGSWGEPGSCGPAHVRAQRVDTLPHWLLERSN